MMNQDIEYEDVRCVKCGTVSSFQKGHLTEQGKREHRCRVCSEVVVERQIQEKRDDPRKLLID